MQTKQIKNYWWKKFFTINVLVAVIIILICIIGLLYINQYFRDAFLTKVLFTPICSAIIAGFIVSLIIDIKKQAADVQSLIVESFVSDSFLDKLPDYRLSDLREKILELLMLNRYPNLQSGLKDKEREIYDALINPYYDLYRETGVYYKNKKFAWGTDSDEESVLFRSVNVKYTIKSPTADTTESIANLSLSKTIQRPKIGNIKSEKDIFIINHFYVTIDNKERIDIKNDISYQTKPLEEIENYYNTSIQVNYTGYQESIKPTCDNKKGIFVSFKENIQVDIYYDIYLPKEDNHFTSRLKYPAKSFRIDCICSDSENVRFYGELLGTFTKNTQIKTSHIKDNMLSIETSDWLLPRNGVFVILCEKSNQNHKI